MNAEELEIARRLVACKGWAWLRGMSVCRGDHPSERWMFNGEAWVSDEGDVYFLPDLCAPASLILGVAAGPELDDAVTRCSVLEVVRRAWGQDDLAARRDGSGTWAVIPENSEWWSGCRDSELEALTHALEAAP